MTETEAAQYLRISTKTLQRRRRGGQIAFIRECGIRYLRADLDAYLAARRTEATKQPPPARKPKYQPSTIKSESNRAALLDIL